MKTMLIERDRIWSATPTPFTADGRVDAASVQRMVAHHADLGIAGIMLAGTCGEGPWLRDRDKEVLARTAVEAARGKLTVALQVTDNSAVRTLDNIERAAAWGVEIAVVAAPSFFMNATPRRLVDHYVEVVRKSSLPVGLYDRGTHSPYVVPETMLPEILAERNIVVLKDSSQNPARRAAYLAMRAARPELVLFTGSEFDADEYLAAGDDGALLGGGIFNAAIAIQLLAAVRAKNLKRATELQARMNDLMYRVYGGQKIECWMTGLKELLVQLGVFSTNVNLLGYPLTDHCRAQITAAVSGADGMGFRPDLLVAKRSVLPLVA